MITAPTMQASPPETTENSMLVAVATAPDSMSPRRGPPWTTAIWMDGHAAAEAVGDARLQDGVAQHGRDHVGPARRWPA